ncbi:MAG: RNA ligase family protein [Treponema sp.]|nr:RNA ligase family protein [Treponema sp.]
MRNLASVCTIEKVWALEGKDKVQGASFKENAYEVMVSKDIQPGMLVAFIQEGSILPEINAWEFLRKRCYRDNLKGFLIKPQKFGTIKSWGLAVPLDELPIADERVINNLKPGDDLTDLLEIRKYEPEEDASPRPSSKKAYPKWVKFCLSHTLTRYIGRVWQKSHQKPVGGFPTDLISKPDETTIQNMKGVLEKFAENKVDITAKLEGQSFTVVPAFKGKKLTGAYVCSRNNAYKVENDSLFWDMMRKYDIVKKMKEIWKNEHKAYILQGEQVGPTIQDNIYDFKQNHWYIFTVKDYETLKQLSYEEQVKIADKFGMRVVPLLWTGTLKDVMPDIDAAVAFAEKASWEPTEDDKIHSWLNLENKGKLWKDYMQHEGVVVRTVDYDKDNNIGVSFKVKNMGYQERGLGKIHQDCVDYKNNNGANYDR